MNKKSPAVAVSV